MLLVKIGGPVYRIGVGGGAASSVAVQGGDSRDAALDFGAVQRGNIPLKSYCINNDKITAVYTGRLTAMPHRRKVPSILYIEHFSI